VVGAWSGDGVCVDLVEGEIVTEIVVDDEHFSDRAVMKSAGILQKGGHNE